ncbi:hypothetical protein BD309DRAFT_964882 [Dichomitus squalens]|uniref:Uncharacterized protein n=2 Tax=Dichomitus squalens TaxID=114155 RepID=A0A4Q9M9E8_9APHY|nr:uncharacterized protein DICSQDRAFT_140719 [Dichomitus squalens LYAD-421 SS1]EJF57050.1 hypothetical protein DICSQDRAFT_140719 [Dichomitus squalens LYAD-421 SS1]TBU22552.1 hypothetical protein BD311DRAFT_782244 [Dichomitus squalens]TBU41626.1 hypothetical protein BD309DRAFT_964882 [Dichomitus squalens]
MEPPASSGFDTIGATQSQSSGILSSVGGPTSATARSHPSALAAGAIAGGLLY